MKYIHIILLIIITNSFSAAQNNEAKADDASRIALASFIPDNITDLTSSSKKFLINNIECSISLCTSEKSTNIFVKPSTEPTA